MCSLCRKHPESTVHLFLQCPFALSIWNWFSSVIRLQVNLSSIKDVLSLANRGWNSQCQVVIIAAIISIVNNIWLCRNSVRFENINPSLTSTIALIISSTSLAGLAACAGIFRNSQGANLGCFGFNIGIANALFAEILGIILAIECAFDRKWWSNCILKIRDMQIIVSHVFREGNFVADKLASL
ncbi:ribonuclease H protein, partial [Trifolium medium]|nr:ribonuclease H protein [Trifolium medium]